LPPSTMLLTPRSSRWPLIVPLLVVAALVTLLLPAREAKIFARGAQPSTCFHLDSCFSSCEQKTNFQYVAVEQDILGCSATCCPQTPPMGTCYLSDHCGKSCATGFVSVAKNSLCEDFCCVRGSSFWLDKCFVDCPPGYHSIAKAGICADLCAPDVPPPAAYPAEFPGAADGFARGIDASGAEIYRYEQNNQVYVVPANDYYAWHSQHSIVTDAALALLFVHAMRRATAPHPHTTPHTGPPCPTPTPCHRAHSPRSHLRMHV